jgi:hypothetical protein
MISVNAAKIQSDCLQEQVCSITSVPFCSMWICGEGRKCAVSLVEAPHYKPEDYWFSIPIMLLGFSIGLIHPAVPCPWG